MEPKNRKWLIKTVENRILGPMPTSEVLSLIRRGDLSGEEQVADYPGGIFHSISSHPEFYDAFLDVLSPQPRQVFPPPGESVVGAEPTEKTRSQSKQFFEEEPEPLTIESDPVFEKWEQKEEAEKKREEKPRRRDIIPQVIELGDIKKIIKEKKKESLKKPILAAIAIMIIAFFFYDSGGPGQQDRIRLLVPNFKGTPLSASKAAERLRSAQAHFLADTFDHYLAAQNDLVRVVEGRPSEVSALALLCMTYYKLWPFANQDKTDLNTIQLVTQTALKTDPVGMFGSTCKTVDRIVRTRMTEANSVVDSTLAAYPAASFLYVLKAEFLASKRDHLTAIGYLQSAQKLLPQWLYIYTLQAELLNKENKSTEAANLYRYVIKQNPKHSVAQILLGRIEFQNFRQRERARELTANGLKASGRLPFDVESIGYLTLAEIAAAESNTKRAIEYAQRAYSIHPGNNDAKALLVRLGGQRALQGTKVKSQQLVFEGDQYIKEGDCKAASAVYKAAYESDKKNAVAAIKAARCLWQLSFTVEAVDWLNLAIQADPKFVEAYVTLADYYTQRYDYFAAAQVLQKVSAIAPQSYEVHRGYALMELRRENPDSAIQFAKAALRLYETDVETLIILSQAYLMRQDYNEAYSTATRSLEIDVNNEEAQMVYAESLAGLQGVDAAGAYMQELVNTYPLIVKYRLGWGKILFNDERYAEAERVFDQATQLDEKEKEAWLFLGKSLRGQGRFAEALEVLLKTAVLDPSDARPIFEAGAIYLQVNKPSDAIKQFQRVLRINKLYPRTHISMGRAYMLMGDPKRALEAATEERRANPNLADSYLLAAEAYSEMRQYSMCAGEYQKAVKLRSQGADIYVRIARCYRLAGNLDVATTMLKHAAGVESGYADIYKEMGAIYEMKGDANEAIQAYNQYFVLNPDAPDRGAIEKRLESLYRRGN